MDIHSLKILNPWWEDPAAIQDDPHIREIRGKPWYFDNPIRRRLALDKGNTFILRGARQVGKTTLMKELIEHAIKKEGFDAVNCLFITCEAISNFEALREMLVEWLETRRKKRTLIVLDEVTFIDEWQRAILWLINAGLMKNATTLISGSNARDLKKSSERFPGRKVSEISLFPLSPSDYRTLKCFKSYTRDQLLNNYLAIGGFPHAIKDFCTLGYVTDDTYETYTNWIFGDAYRFDLTREILMHILFRIYDTLASQITYQRLVEKSPIKSHETAQAYVEHLETAFLCTVLGCYDPDKDMAAPRKAKKIYFIDPLLYGVAGGFLRGIRNTFRWWKELLEDGKRKGNIFESIVANNFVRTHERTYYWYSANTRREADIIIRKGDDLKVYEVKSKPESVKPILGKAVEVITPQSFDF